jgi:hypothetical protein
MSGNCQSDEVHNLITHIEECADALRFRIEAIGSDSGDELPSPVKSELAMARHSCRFLREAVAKLQGRLAG